MVVKAKSARASGCIFACCLWLFYTVIPLYQNAVLSEAIAEKELKLSQLRDELRSIQAKMLQDGVRGFVVTAGIKCGGLLEGGGLRVE